MDVNMKLKLLSEERDGPILRCLYACPCGQGTVEEEQDYTEGHRDCWASLECSICRNNYKQRWTRGYKRYKETSGLIEWKECQIFHSIFT